MKRLSVLYVIKSGGKLPGILIGCLYISEITGMKSIKNYMYAIGWMLREPGFDFPDAKKLSVLQIPDRPCDPVGTRAYGDFYGDKTTSTRS